MGDPALRGQLYRSDRRIAWLATIRCKRPFSASESGVFMTDRFGILSCRAPRIAVVLSLAANLIWIPQALILADTVAAVSIGPDAELTRLSPITLASIFALLLVARSAAEAGAFAIRARPSTATQLG